MKLSKFNMFKKSQSAMEFMLIFVFIMGSVSIFMMVVGLYTQDLTVQENDKQIDSFANSIISEFEVLQEVEKGYTREIIIPKYLLEKFNITIIDNYLVIEDRENFNNLTNQRFYDIAGEYELNKFNDSKGDLHLVLNPIATLSSNKLINLNTPSPPIANLNFLIDSLNIQTYTVSYMQDIILSWESFNVTNDCIASGDWAGLKGFSGNETIFNPKGNKIFNLDCSGLVNTASSSINLTVDAPLFPTLTFMASPPVIPYNTKTNLSWQAQNMYDITSCSAGGNWTGSKFTNGSELTPNLISNTTYFLSCTNPSGTIIENVTIEVLELPEINLTINQSVIDFNTSTILNWNVKYASSCSASNDWSGNKSITGNFSTGNLLNGTYNYTLNCIGPGGNNSKSVSLEVGPNCSIINGVNTCDQCTIDGGTIFNINGSISVCRFTEPNENNCAPSSHWTIYSNWRAVFNGATTTTSVTSPPFPCDPNNLCPIGWTQYQNWSTTIEFNHPEATTKCSPYGNRCLTRWDCSTGQHAFSNIAREHCQAGVHEVTSCDRPRTVECYAGATEVGCY